MAPRSAEEARQEWLSQVKSDSRTTEKHYNDALDVRAITRVRVGFLHEAAVIRGYDAA